MVHIQNRDLLLRKITMGDCACIFHITCDRPDHRTGTVLSYCIDVIIQKGQYGGLTNLVVQVSFLSIQCKSVTCSYSLHTS